MTRRNQTPPFRVVLLAGVLSALMLGQAPRAAAEDTTARLLEVLRANGTLSAAQYESLKRSLGESAEPSGEAVSRQLIEVLHANGTLSDAAYHELTGEAPAVTEAQEPIEPATTEEPAVTEAEQRATEPAAEAAAEEQKEEEEGFDIDVGSGGVVIESKDGESAFALGGRVHVDGAWFDNDGDTESGNATEVRRFRIELDGRINRVWEYGASIDFGGGDLSLKSTYVSYVGFEGLSINAGNWKEPFSLEELDSSNNMPFMERASVNVLAPGRNPGVGAEAYGKHWTLGGGAFGEGFADEHEDGVDGSYGFVGRATVAPWVEDTRVLHFGAASEYRLYDNDAEVSFDERWDVHLADEPLVDTGVILGIDDIVRMGAEAAGVLGPFTAQAEWIGARIDREDGAATALLDGWYVYGAWTLTGESRQYKSKRGRFEGIEPFRPVGDGGAGAWQIGARYGVLDLSDEDIEGGQQDVLTLGLNWYATRNIRFMANWVDVLVLDRSGAVEDGDEPAAFQVRSQVNW